VEARVVERVGAEREVGAREEAREEAKGEVGREGVERGEEVMAEGKAAATEEGVD
jgi:hypothetical protein